MTREVLVAIKGTQRTPENGEDTTEVITRGDYFYKNGRHYLLYEQIDPDDGSITKNTVKFSSECVENIKRGQTNCDMVFEPGKKNTFTYNTPFGSLLLGTDCEYLRVQEEEKRILLEVSYHLEMNCEPAAECLLRIEITPKAEGKKLS